MAKFEIWKRGKVYEVIFREGGTFLYPEIVSVLAMTKSLATAKKRLKYHRGRMYHGYLLKEDPSVWKMKINRKAKLKKVI